MPIEREWNPTTRTWVLTTGEVFDLAEIADLVKEVEWNGATRYLWDLRGLQKGPDSSGELRQAVDIVQRTRELWAGSRTAILVTRDLDFGIARMFGAFAESVDVEYRVFRDERTAFEWLESVPDEP